MVEQLAACFSDFRNGVYTDLGQVQGMNLAAKDPALESFSGGFSDVPDGAFSGFLH